MSTLTRIRSLTFKPREILLPGLLANNNYLYATPDNYFLIYDISNPSNPINVGFLFTGESTVSGIVIKDNFMLI